MNDAKRNELALKTLGASIGLGILGNLLLRDTPWGIGFTLYAFLVAAVGLYLNRNADLKVARDLRWVTAAALLFATLFAWRDADTLKLLNGTALVLAVGLIVLRARGGDLTLGTLTDYPFRLFNRWFVFIADFIHLVDDSGKACKNGNQNLALFRKLLSGLLLATPVLLIFGGLFMNADATFEHLIERAFSFDLEAMWYHVLFTILGTWMVGGFFRSLFLQVAPPPSSQVVVSKPVFGMTELGVVLALLDALFAAFVVVQFRHFFGGDSVVHSTAGLGYAEYARRGFFELMTVAALALTVLVSTHHVLRKASPTNPRAFTGLAAVLVALVFVVLASAAHRMGLYIQAYGISQLRIYCIAIMGWLAVVFAWFSVTVLRSRPQWFAFGALASFGLAIFFLNLVNPDAMIVRINTGRVANRVDTAYLSDLSVDAVPELVAALPHVRADVRKALEEGLANKRERILHRDWRSWNVSSATAHRSFE